MENPDLNNLTLKGKKDKVIETVYLTCEFCNLSVPKINFNGCKQEKRDQLAHYHPDEKKICISERQLKLQNLTTLEDTTIHEVIHHLGLNHGSQEEKVKFRQIKQYIKSRGWKPDRGVGYGSAYDTSKHDSGVNKNKDESDLGVDPESDFRILIHQLEEARGREERMSILRAIERLRANHNIEIKSEDKNNIDRLDSEDKEIVNRILTGNPYSDKEWEAIINKVYENYNTDFVEYKRQWDKDGREITNRKPKNDKFESDYQKFKQRLEEKSKTKETQSISSKPKKQSRLMCYLGFHKWQKVGGVSSVGRGRFKSRYTCSVCSKFRTVIT
jgi:hypothetical protein